MASKGVRNGTRPATRGGGRSAESIYRLLYGWPPVALLEAGGAAAGDELEALAARAAALRERYAVDADFDALLAGWRRAYRPRRVEAPGVPLANNGFVKGVEIFSLLHEKWGLFGAPLDAYHLAELPGGFYFAAQHLAALHGVEVRARIQSLVHERQRGADYVPLRDETCFFGSRGLLDCGPAGGDLTSAEERAWLAERVGPRDLVTADGGVDYRAREDLDFLLALYRGEAEVALACLRPRGVFAMKLYLVLEERFYRFVDFLRRRFRRVVFWKPTYSKPHSYEMYALCRGPLPAEEAAEEAATGPGVFAPVAAQVCRRVLAVHELYEAAGRLPRAALQEVERRRHERLAALLGPVSSSARRDRGRPR